MTRVVSLELIMTADDKFGIWPPYEAFYIEGMLFNAGSVLSSAHIAMRELEKLNNNGPDTPIAESDRNAILDSLQNIIIQGAALSRYFWPARAGRSNEHTRRAEHLRKHLKIRETSPLKSRDLRNQIEHFDEKLDEYLTKGIVGTVLPGHISSTRPETDAPLHFLRAFYAKDGIFEMLGKSYEVQPLVDEIHRIYKLLYQCTQNGYRLGHPLRKKKK